MRNLRGRKVSIELGPFHPKKYVIVQLLGHVDPTEAMVIFCGNGYYRTGGTI